MRRIEVSKKDLDYKDFVKRTALESDYSTLITEDCAIFDKDTGRLLMIYKRLDLDEREIVEALKNVNYITGERTTGLKSTSRIFGFMPRVTIRQDYCHVASLANEQPAEHRVITDYAKVVADLYAEADPSMFQLHSDQVSESVIGQYIIPGTPFTSGIINKNNPLKYHFDTGNFKKVYSCMLAFKKDVEGGYLAMPEYDVGLEIANNSVMIFDGQEILHGVTPIKYLTPDAHRYTIVYYSLQQMWKCLPLDEEVLRIRNLKTEREKARTGENYAEVFPGGKKKQAEAEEESLGDVV